MKIKDFATGRSLPLTAEEGVRQEYERILVEDYGYEKSEIGIEVSIPRGTGFFPDRADIVIFKTARGVVDLAVRLVDPQPEETVCDPACGSGGFLIHTMRWIWKKMDTNPRWKNSPHIHTLKQKIARQSIFGIDKENDLVKIAKAYMAIAGDGRSNIVHDNALHDLKKLSPHAKQKFIKNEHFKAFDVVLTNPPFGSKIKVTKADSANFELGHIWKKEAPGKWIKKDKTCERDPYVLFVERCFDILSEKGRLAIVLPETVFHAPKTEYLRHFIQQHARIKAIIELPHNAFRPHCNAKTCLLLAEIRPFLYSKRPYHYGCPKRNRTRSSRPAFVSS